MLLLTAAVGASLCSCAISRFDGLYEENLSKYLTLGPYKGLTVTDYDTKVSESELEAAVEEALKALSAPVETEEGITESSIVRFDRFCFIDGESRPEYSAEGVSYDCADKTGDAVAYSLLSRMIGMKKGETAELEVLIPAGYMEDGSPETKATYRVTVLSVSEKVTPTLDDETAERLMPGCGGAEGYRSETRKRLEAGKKADADYRREAEIWKKIIDGSVLIDAPYDVYSVYYEELYLSYRKLAEVQSQSLGEYVEEFYGMSEQELEDQIGEQALDRTKEAFVLYSIVRAEEITFTDEELSAFAASCAAASGGVFASGKDYLDHYGKEQVGEMLLKDKVIALALAEAA